MAINPSIITRDLDKIADKTGNIYESLHVVGQRAKQISNTLKEELNIKLSEALLLTSPRFLLVY